MIYLLNKTLYRFLYWSTATTAFLFFAMVCTNVITRYLLKTPILASIELSRLFFVWSCFLAAGITYYKKGHIAISFITDKFSDKWRTLIDNSIYLLTLLFLSTLTWWSVQVVYTLWFTEFPILGISQGWLYIPLSLVSLIMIFFNIELLFTGNPPFNPTKNAGDTHN